jgi:hypothetical protein
MHCPPISQALKATGRRIIENRLARFPSSNAQIIGAGRQTFLKKLGGLSKWTGMLLGKG